MVMELGKVGVVVEERVRTETLKMGVRARMSGGPRLPVAWREE